MNTTSKILWIVCGVLAGVAITLALLLLLNVQESDRTLQDVPVVNQVKSASFETTDRPELADVSAKKLVPEEEPERVASEPVTPVALPREEPEPSQEFLAAAARVKEEVANFAKIEIESELPKFDRSPVDLLADLAQTGEEKETASALTLQYEEAKKNLIGRQEDYIDEQLRLVNDRLTAAVDCGTAEHESLARNCEELTKNLDSLPNSTDPGREAEVRALTDRVQGLSQRIERSRAVYDAVREYDARFRDTVVGSGILKEIATAYPESEYAADFAAVAASCDVMESLEKWNAFVTNYGAQLARFSVDSATAKAVLDFYHGNAHLLKFLPEWKTLSERSEALTVAMRRKPVQERILPLIRHGGARDFWLYRPDAKHWYYLLAEPKPGENRWLADLYGGEQTIVLPHDAVAGIKRDPQPAFFRQLAERVEALPDTLQVDDIGTWYTEWSNVVESVRQNTELDPIVRMLYLKDICTALSQSDLQYQKRLASWLRVLNTKPFNGHVNWYAADKEETSRLRENAKGLLAFLEKDPLHVVRTTRELDETVKSIAARYVCIGWLDRTFGGRWFVRGSDEPGFLPDGELFVLATSDKGEPRLVKIGDCARGEIAVTLASDALRAGSRVYCRQ
ncbi:MAG: hypothetical protein Q4G68_04960 [Planctomycetia bacterium]|nr:hypothetical protein [Planctomycetia bacterium]